MTSGGLKEILLEPNRTILLASLDETERDDEVIGLLLTGSLARGDALPGTDLDLVYVLADGHSRPFSRELVQGIVVERAYIDEPAEVARLHTNPMRIYGHLDGRILRDPEGALERLRLRARRLFESYATPDPERVEVAFLLRCSRDKMRVALGGGDLLKAAYVASTSSWQIMVGLWAANDLPLPPNSSVRPHLRDLSGPPDIEPRYRALFLADAEHRVQVALDLIDWILRQLGGTDW